MHFTRLRLAGFKSFVDPTEFLIEPGLTGIVGPNGCGKSNLLEALRWIMGEASPSRVRGGAMEDVIFAGTELRPARNVAEVMLALGNPDRDAPSAWNDHDEIQVSRRIERGGGSAYLINGQDARARDVRNFFADIASGTASSALVNQGQVADLIRRKPAARRHLLEEAAGIAGLQSRRHEAELRLGAAERNLEQLLSVIENLEARHANLRRQERQAQRYRNLGRRIRDAEMRWRLRLWLDATAGQDAAADDLASIEDEVNDATRTVAEATRLAAEADEAVPPLRQSLQDADRALHRLEVARDVLRMEDERVANELQQTRAGLEHLGRDLARENELEGDARRSLGELAEELDGLRLGEENDAAAIAKAREAAEEARARVGELEASVLEKTREAASLEAGRRTLGERIDECGSRLAVLAEDAAANERERAALPPADEAVAEVDRRLEAETSAGEALARERSAFERFEAANGEARRREEEARLAVREAGGGVESLRTEREALAAQAWSHERGDEAPVLDRLEVAAGYEQALGAALGDDLDAPLGTDGERGWALVPGGGDSPSLPPGAEPLSRHVSGPPELERRLQRTGVVGDAEGDAMARGLQPGERLVSPGGNLWRWDGYFARGSRSGAAIRLAQRARLETLAGELEAAEEVLQAAAADRAAAEDAAKAARDSEEGARRSVNRHGDLLAAARHETAAARGARQTLEERRDHLVRIAGRLDRERGELESVLDAARQELASLPEDGAGAGLDGLRRELEICRGGHLDRQRNLDRLNQEKHHRMQRIEAIGRERRTWEQRIAQAQAQIASQEERRVSLESRLRDLERRPGHIARQMSELAGKIEEGAAGRREASDRLAAAEALLDERSRALRSHEAALQDKREERVRREGVLAGWQQRAGDIALQVRERLETTPDDLRDLVDDSASLADADELQRRYDRAVRERDTIGPVNLRAGIELEEVDKEIAVMTSEKEDLEKAISRLRRAIGELNREGRQRLLDAFHAIDAHFQALHRRLFGGHARLTLVDSDDPLEAGLEIEANPSGKKLQTLSLLSGGEQAMAALALIFALFLTNPSPVCVLDEVDAPLDDANVTRFCDMLDEFAAAGATRFLIITHHRITMARMHRLYGVTMGEPGVSQLVSVDLDAAERLKEDGR